MQIDTRHASGVTVRNNRFWAPIYLDRPEQLSIAKWRETTPCAFHTSGSKAPVVVKEYPDIAEGMVLQGALFASHTRHELLRPLTACWSEEDIRRLGGPDRLLAIYEGIFAPLMQERKPEWVHLVQYVGRTVGMSQPDFHVHFLTNPMSATAFAATCGPEALQDLRRSKMTVTESGNIRMVCQPVFGAGQCWIIPSDGSASRTDDLVKVLISATEMFAQAFTSKQGLPPDFSMLLRFLHGQFHSGVYTPRLAPPGAEQTMAMLFPDIAIPHQFPPEEVLELLRRKQS